MRKTLEDLYYGNIIPKTAVMNCSCWRLPPACGGASFWLSSGTISISRPGRCGWNDRFIESRVG